MLAALTIGKRLSAFLATVMESWGKMSESLAWYFPGSPTVSTYTWLRVREGGREGLSCEGRNEVQITGGKEAKRERKLASICLFQLKEAERVTSSL